MYLAQENSQLLMFSSVLYSVMTDFFLCSVQVKREVGDVSILVNNAGIVTGKKFMDAPDSLIEKTMEVNIMAHFWVSLTQHLSRPIYSRLPIQREWKPIFRSFKKLIAIIDFEFLWSFCFCALSNCGKSLLRFLSLSV